jgi:uncharacterized protein YndB with AHSA1/START domain
MAIQSPSNPDLTERSVMHATFVIERTLNASPSRVFSAFASQEAKARWFVGPKGWQGSDHSLDFRAGGREHLSSRQPNGPAHEFDAIYHDIVPDRRIVYSYEMHLDEKRISVSLATLELLPAGTGTKLVLTEHGAFLDGTDRPDQREQGTQELLNNLETYLRRGGSHRMELSLVSDTEIAVKRVFDAPRRLVFEASSKCEHIARWWGPRGFELTSCEIDFRVGGGYRFVQKAPDGTIHPFRGEYREIVAPERLVMTQIYEPFANDVVVVITILTEREGRTTLDQRLVFDTIQSRDGMIAAGMEWGQAQSFERLDEFLADMQLTAR